MPSASVKPSTPHVAVIGGGPAGLMAAETIATGRMSVTVFEAGRSVGRKLLLAGRTGLNLTNAEELDALLDRYRCASSEVVEAVRAFPPTAVSEWSAGLGEPTHIGSTGRVFPASMRATPLLRAWLARLTELGVEFALGHRFDGWENEHTRFRTADGGRLVAADSVVLALGGASWPRTGSDGAWVNEIRRRGVGVTPFEPSNCGVLVGWSDHFSDRFAGVPLKNVALSVGGRVERGDPVVTRTGLESGPVYALSPNLRDAFGRDGHAGLHVDLQPDRTIDRLAAHLTTVRRPKDSFSTWMRRAGVSPVQVGLLREVTANRPPSDAGELASLLKRVPVTVTGLASIDRAISSAGGIALDEIDSNLMLRKVPGTFVAGEMLDWDAPTGGYLLQACLSTGAAAGEAVLAYLNR